MIDASKLEPFSNFITTLKETSLDNANNVYMTESFLEVIDFDAFKEDYAQKRELNEDNTPRSCDALFVGKDKQLHFIEFKNGKSKRGKRPSEIKEKIYDSLLVFLETTGTTISEISQYANVIVVYNEHLRKNDSVVEASTSYNTIVHSVSTAAKKPLIQFGLASFKKYCFKEVQTLTPSQFEKHLQSL